MSRPFAVLDVFTDTMFGGNRLAIVDDADGLDSASMQAIAREFGFPETLFVCTPDDAANHLAARIFTPGREIPFAGHPNVGLGVWAGLNGHVRGAQITDEVRAEEGAGLVVLSLGAEDGAPTATLTAPAPLSLGREVSVERVAAAGELSTDMVRLDRHRPIEASVGMAFVFVELVSADALKAARPVVDAFDGFDVADGLHQVAYYVRDGGRARMRMFAPPHDILEDPATGSAAGALAGLTAHLDPGADAVVSLDISQGEEMGRPSRIAAHAEKTGGAVRAVRVGGRAVLVMAGVLEI